MKYYRMFLILFFTLSIEIFALPRFALREGSACSDCHVNPTGGNLRNYGGWVWGKTFLPMISPREKFDMSNKLNENILFGFDLRGQLLGRMTDSTTQMDFQRMTGSVYTSVGLSEEINVFARYDFIQAIWEAYGTAHILPNNSYIKGGTFQPNYGIRVDDHTAYTRGGDLGLLFATGIRQGLIYDPRYVESGIELGINISDFAFLTGSVGNPRQAPFSSDPTYTANLKFFPSLGEGLNLFFGGSFAAFRGSIPPSFTRFPEVKMYGGYIGIGVNKFTLMGEYDIADDYIVIGSQSSSIMAEAAYQITNGIEAVVRYDSFDPDNNADNDDVSRLILGFEIFPYQFIEIRPQYRIQMEEPKVDNDSFLVQIHLFY